MLLLILRAEVGTVFALSWLITWFGHVLSDFRHVVRLYDFFLACHPLMPIYFAAVVSFLSSALLVAVILLLSKLSPFHASVLTRVVAGGIVVVGSPSNPLLWPQYPGKSGHKSFRFGTNFHFDPRMN